METSEATVKEVSISSFIMMLRSDIVKFKFIKKDGSERIAYGTRNPKIIAAVIGTTAAHDGIEKKKKPEYIIVYFDMEKGCFRSFNESRFVGVIEEHAKYEPAAVSENAFVNFDTFSMITEMLDCEWCEDDEEAEEEE